MFLKSKSPLEDNQSHHWLCCKEKECTWCASVSSVLNCGQNPALIQCWKHVLYGAEETARGVRHLPCTQLLGPTGVWCVAYGPLSSTRAHSWVQSQEKSPWALLSIVQTPSLITTKNITSVFYVQFSSLCTRSNWLEMGTLASELRWIPLSQFSRETITCVLELFQALVSLVCKMQKMKNTVHLSKVHCQK